jgi:hypothetical protein
VLEAVVQLLDEPETFAATVADVAGEAVGQWPTAEAVVRRPAEALREAAEAEDDEESKSRLRQLVGFIGGETGKNIVAEVIAKVILRPTGMG